MSKVLIIGCGDIGMRVGVLAREQGDSVSGMTRQAARAEQCRAAGIEPVMANLDDPASYATLPTGGTLIYYFAPPPSEGTRDRRIRSFLHHISSSRPERIVYISTTAVYGDCHGEWVNEETATDPQSLRGKRRLDAEAALLAWYRETAVPLVILRVAGIYGPNRLPLEKLQRGDPILKPELSPYTNLIHADDLAQICIAAATYNTSADIFNVCTGNPTTMSEYFFLVADRAGLPRPHTISWDEAARRLTPAMMEFLRESKRVANDKLLNELGVTLRYPDLAEGITAALEET